MESAVKSTLDYPYPVTAQGFRMQLEALSNFSSLDRLNRIRAATLLMAGKKDNLIPAAEMQLLADKVSSAKIKYLENAAHSFQVEQPDLFVSCTADFLLKSAKTVSSKQF